MVDTLNHPDLPLSPTRWRCLPAPETLMSIRKAKLLPRDEVGWISRNRLDSGRCPFLFLDIPFYRTQNAFGVWEIADRGRDLECERMGHQTQLHLFPKDVNDLLVAMHDKESLEGALRSGRTANLERLAFIPENMTGQILVLWSERFAPSLQRGCVNAQPPYYRVDAQTELVLELSLSALTTWEGQPALTQGRIYGVFESKHPEFGKFYERLVRYIRRHWRKNPTSWMQGYVGPAASGWFERGGVLLPNYIPPVRSDWIKLLGEQHQR